MLLTILAHMYLCMHIQFIQIKGVLSVSLNDSLHQIIRSAYFYHWHFVLIFFTSPLIYLLLCRFAIMKHFLIICDSDNTLKLNIIYFLSGLTLWLKTKINLSFKIIKQCLLYIWFSKNFYWVINSLRMFKFYLSYYVCLGKNWVYRIRVTVN